MRTVLLLIVFTVEVALAHAQLADIDRRGFNSGGVIHIRLNGALGDVFVFDLNDDSVGIQSGKVFPMSIEPMDTLLSIQVYQLYPNPANNTLKIRLPQTYRKRLKVQVYDISGKRLLVKRIARNTSEFELDISDLTNGAYLLSIDGDKKWRFETIRFIKN